jgi:hypothetical protein
VQKKKRFELLAFKFDEVFDAAGSVVTGRSRFTRNEIAVATYTQVSGDSLPFLLGKEAKPRRRYRNRNSSVRKFHCNQGA